MPVKRYYNRRVACVRMTNNVGAATLQSIPFDLSDSKGGTMQRHQESELWALRKRGEGYSSRQCYVTMPTEGSPLQCDAVCNSIALNFHGKGSSDSSAAELVPQLEAIFLAAERMQCSVIMLPLTVTMQLTPAARFECTANWAQLLRAVAKCHAAIHIVIVCIEDALTAHSTLSSDV